MKKTIMASSALACLLICSSSFANNNKPTGLYLKGFYNYSPSIRSMYGIGAGYKFGLFRVESQYSYGQYSPRHFYGQYFSSRKHNVDALGYLDLDNKPIFSPYIGLGVGYSDFSNKYFKQYGPSLIAAIGSRVYLNQNLALDLGYKNSLGTSRPNIGDANIGLTFHF